MTIQSSHPRSNTLGIPILPCQVINFGYIEGNFTSKSSGSTGMWVAFDGDITKTFVQAALTPSQTTDGIIGYDFGFSHPNGIKIEKVEVVGTSDQGFIVLQNPTDVVISLEGWNGVWNALGSTPVFTDANSLTKTIISTDQTTLFTRFRILVSTTANRIRALANIKLFQVSQGEVSFNVIDGVNITPGINSGTGFGKPEDTVNGIQHPLGADSLISSVATISDFIIPYLLDRPRNIEKVTVYGSSDGGFFVSSNPVDARIFLEGFNGTIWVALGDTGIFIDANSLVKEIISTDQITKFDAFRIKISSASNVFRAIGEVEFCTPAPVAIPASGYAMAGNNVGGATQDNDSYIVDVWTSRTDLLSPGRAGHTGASLLTKGYVFSGNNGVSRIRDVDEFDPAIDSWAVKTDIILPSRIDSASTDILNKGYLFGGTDVIGNLSDTDEYSSTTDSWTSKTSMVAPVRSQFKSSTILNKGYVFGGFTPNTRLRDTDEYNPDVWTVKTDMPLPARLDGAVFTLPTNIAYICSGNDIAATLIRDTDEYNPDTWVSRTDMPLPARTEAGAFNIDTKGYICYGNSPTLLVDTDEYIFDAWTSVSNAPTPSRSDPEGMTI